MTQKQRRVLSCFSLVLALAFTMSSIVAAHDSDFNVRAAGMGGAYTALSSGPAGLVYNPAGIGLRSFELTLSASAPGLEDLQALALLSNEFNAENYDKLPETLDLGTMAGLSIGPIAVAGKARVNAVIVKGETSDTVMAIAVPEVAGGLGFYIFKAPLGVFSLRLGASGHFYQVNLSQYEITDGAVTNEDSIKGKGQYFSLGAMANITPWITVGLSARDLAGSLSFEDTEPLEFEPLYTLGAAVKLPLQFIGITLAADVDSNDELRYGAELNLASNLLSLRAGQIRLPQAMPVAAASGTITTVGLGLNLGPLSAGVAAQTFPGEKLSQEGLDRIVMEGTLRF